MTVTAELFDTKEVVTRSGIRTIEEQAGFGTAIFLKLSKENLIDLWDAGIFNVDTYVLFSLLYDLASDSSNSIKFTVDDYCDRWETNAEKPKRLKEEQVHASISRLKKKGVVKSEPVEVQLTLTGVF